MRRPIVALRWFVFVGLVAGCKPPTSSKGDRDADQAGDRDEVGRQAARGGDKGTAARKRPGARPGGERRQRDDEPADPLAGGLAKAMELLGTFAKGTGIDDALGGADDAAQGDAGDPRKVIVHSIIDGVANELEDPFDFFGVGASSLRSAIDVLDKAARDPKVAAVLVEPVHFRGGAAKVEAVRRAIEALRATGKRVFALVTDPGASEYMVALAAEEIAVAPTGSWMVTGARAEALYLKDLLGSVGLAFDAVAIGDYKTAAESLVRSQMSKEMREVLDSILDERVAALASAVVKARKIDAAKLTVAIDEAPHAAAEAVKRGLVDRIAYRDDYVREIGKKLNLGDDAKAIRDYGKKKKKFDLASMFSLSSLFGGAKKEKRSGKQKIAVVYAVGPILPGRGGRNPLIQERAIFAESFIETLNKVKEERDVKAVVLRVDSPGGSATASDQIWRAVEDLKGRMPVIASFGDVAASGGYYISAGANAIVAEAGTITGSIGVIGGKLVTDGLMKKIHVNREVMSRGKNSGLFSGATSFSATERAALERVMKATYQEFLARVARGRKLDAAKVEAIARGRVWTGAQAKANGLVDEIGSLREAIQLAKQRAGIAPVAGKPDDTEIVVYPKEKSLLEWVQEGLGTAIWTRVAVDAVAGLFPLSVMRGLLPFVNAWKALVGVRSPWAMMPFALAVE